MSDIELQVLNDAGERAEAALRGYAEQLCIPCALIGSQIMSIARARYVAELSEQSEFPIILMRLERDRDAFIAMFGLDHAGHPTPASYAQTLREAGLL